MSNFKIQGGMDSAPLPTPMTSPHVRS